MNFGDAFPSVHLLVAYYKSFALNFVETITQKYKKDKNWCLFNDIWNLHFVPKLNS